MAKSKAIAAKELNNRQAYFNYNIEDKYVAGMVLLGTEVKSIREGKVSFNDSFCFLIEANYGYAVYISMPTLMVLQTIILKYMIENYYFKKES